MPIRILWTTAFLCLFAGACTQAPVSADDPGSGTPNPNTGLTGSQQTDWAAIQKLEEAAKAIAKTTGCSSSSDCKAAPVGSRACGGPRYYLPYCAKTTDSAALYRKLDEVAKAEQAYNRKYNVASTCEFRMPPAVEVVGGSCVAK